MTQCAGGDRKWWFHSVRDFCRHFEFGRRGFRDWRGVNVDPVEEASLWEKLVLGCNISRDTWEYYTSYMQHPFLLFLIRRVRSLFRSSSSVGSVHPTDTEKWKPLKMPLTR